MRRFSVKLATTSALCAAILVTPLHAAEMPTPQEIFTRAFERLQSYPLPAYVVWSDLRSEHAAPMVPGGLEGDDVYQIRYAVRIADGMENTSPFPSPANQLPPALVEPQFQGLFAWSMRTVHVPSQASAMLQPDIPTDLKTIAHVTARAPEAYAIALAGIETVEGHRTYHIVLTPRSDPAHHNLRDLWVDVDTFDLWKAHFIGRYAPVPSALPSESDVTVFFEPVGLYWIASHMLWTWDDAGDSARISYDVYTQNVTFPSALPDWLFDQGAYDAHRKASDPDYLGPFLKPSSPASSP